MMQSDNIFRHVWNLGYRSILPILPPDAVLSQRSNLARAKDVDKLLGKVPGEKRGDEWFGMPDWQAHETTEIELDAWHASGAGLALRMDDGLVALDIDVSDVETSEDIERDALAMLGPSPCRIGRYPRRMLLYRITERVSYQRLTFTGPPDATEAIEVSCGKRQMVCFGIHQKTGKPYTWPRPLPAFRELTEITPHQLGNFVAQQRAKRPASAVVTEKERSERVVDPRTLPGDPDLIGAAMREMPNGRALYPTRDDYIRMGAALKAALPNDPALAYDLWTQWAARDDDGGTPEIWEKDWRGIKPPYAVGAHFVLDEADRHGNFGKEQWMLEDQDEVDRKRLENPFAATTIDPEPKKEDAIRATPYDFPEPAAIPRRQMLYGHHYVRQFVSTTAAPTKVGKSSLTIVEALAMASGKPLLGVKVVKPLRVWLWNGEDPIDELRRRVAAAMKHYGLTRDDLVDEEGRSRLYLDSGRDMEIVLATSGRDGTKIAEPVELAVTGTIRTQGIDVVVVDPFVSSHRVSENDNNGIDMVAKRWARIADRTRTAIDLVHHVRKLNGGEVTIEDTRGASALISAARSARALARMTRGEGQRIGLDAAASRRLFRFADSQSNLALPAGVDETWMELRSVELGNGGGEWARGDSVGVVAIWEGAGPTTGGEDGAPVNAVLARLQDIVRAGTWKKDPRAGDAWIGNAVAQAYQLDASDTLDRARVRSLTTDLIRSGVLVEVARYDDSRNMRVFVEAPEDKTSNNVFD